MFSNTHHNVQAQAQCLLFKPLPRSSHHLLIAKTIFRQKNKPSVTRFILRETRFSSAISTVCRSAVHVNLSAAQAGTGDDFWEQLVMLRAACCNALEHRVAKGTRYADPLRYRAEALEQPALLTLFPTAQRSMPRQML